MTATEELSKIVCNECDVPAAAYHRYCRNCGAFLNEQATTINIFNNQNLRFAFAFYFAYLVICLLVKHTPYFNTYQQLFWVELLLAGITTAFAFQNRSSILPVVRFNNFKPLLLGLLIILAAVSSIVINFTIRKVNITFFNSEISYYEGYKMYHHPLALMVYSIALLPSIFEELAFRGVMYNYCKTFLDERLVVAVTAFLFAIMHLSLLSLVWLLPFAFLLGHLRRRYNTIWYGVAFHFTFNLTACIIDLYRNNLLPTF